MVVRIAEHVSVSLYTDPLYKPKSTLLKRVIHRVFPILPVFGTNNVSVPRDRI